jgi:5'-deoxynucleotidase YfbR-like HD superfamily hydrolase
MKATSIYTGILDYSPRVPRTDDNFIRTFTGGKFWPLDPRPEEISVEDVAHHLAHECRFSGATRCHYSVADHALRVSRLAEKMVMDTPGPRTPALLMAAREIALWGLHHDDSEGLGLRDLARPVKRAAGPLGEIYRAIESMVMDAVIDRFDLMPHEPSVVIEADAILCATEGRDLIARYRNSRGSAQLPETIVPLTAEEAEVEFIRRHNALTMARSIARTEGVVIGAEFFSPFDVAAMSEASDISAGMDATAGKPFSL